MNDYKNMIECAYNRKPKRIPLYEHCVSDKIMEKLLNIKFSNYIQNKNTYDLYFSNYCKFYEKFGYDTVSFEGCITAVLLGGGALGRHVSPVIKNRNDFQKYPFDQIVDLYIQRFDGMFSSLSKNMPQNMKAIGGVGNGVFEIVQDLVGYENLCLMSFDDPLLYADLFKKVGNLMLKIWKYVLDNYGDLFCVCRFGDDLGHKSNTMLSYDDIKVHIIPQYKRIISFIKSYNKPFLLHSCGNIFNVFEDIINCGINAKHSNEDAIADFSKWVELYGDRISNFGGIDTDMLVRGKDEKIITKVEEIYNLASKKQGGIAIGSGNSIPDYVNEKKYLLMINTVRKIRGDF